MHLGRRRARALPQTHVQRVHTKRWPRQHRRREFALPALQGHTRIKLGKFRVCLLAAVRQVRSMSACCPRRHRTACVLPAPHVAARHTFLGSAVAGRRCWKTPCVCRASRHAPHAMGPMSISVSRAAARSCLARLLARALQTAHKREHSFMMLLRKPVYRALTHALRVLGLLVPTVSRARGHWF